MDEPLALTIRARIGGGAHILTILAADRHAEKGVEYGPRKHLSQRSAGGGTSGGYVVLRLEK